MKKKLLAIILAASMVVALAACGSSGGGTTQATDASADTTAAEETTKSIQEDIKDQNDETAIAADVVESDYVADVCNIIGNQSSTLLPWGKSPGENALSEVYEYLFTYIDYCGDVKACLADASRGEFEGYDHEAGTGVYTVYIYDYITDQAGNKITADDVKWSYETNRELGNLSGTAWGKLESIDVIDDTTIQYTFSDELTGIDDWVDFMTSSFIIDEESYNASPSELTSDACGTGPYKVAEYNAGTSVKLVLNEDYWQTNDELKLQCQKQNVKEINYLVNSEAAQQVIALQTGVVDVVSNVAAQNLTDFIGEGQFAKDFSIFQYAQSGTCQVYCNQSTESICNDINMRLAIFYAIDVEGVCDAVGRDRALQAYSLFGSAQSDFQEKWKDMDNYQNKADPDLVKEYLEKANYDGRTLKFICNQAESDLCQIILNQLVNAGIPCELSTLDRTTYDAAETNPAAWDIACNKCSAATGAIAMTRIWSLMKNTGMTRNYIDDAEWNDMLLTMTTVDGHTDENTDAWMQRNYENAYAIGLYSTYNNIVYNNKIATLCRNGKNVFLPGGFTYNDPAAK